MAKNGIISRQPGANYDQCKAYREKCRAARAFPKSRKFARREIERTLPGIIRAGNRAKNRGYNVAG